MIVYCFFAIIIEKCSSPTGDGNSMSMWRSTVAFDTLRNVVPRQGTETFRKVFTIVMYFVIEKCSSPTGDGNPKLSLMNVLIALRNVVPRQGTET